MIKEKDDDTIIPLCYNGRAKIFFKNNPYFMKMFVHDLFHDTDLGKIVKKDLKKSDEKVSKIHLEVNFEENEILNIVLDYEEFIDILNNHR